MTEDQAIDLVNHIRQQTSMKAVEKHQLGNGDWVCRLWRYFYVWNLDNWQEVEQHPPIRK